MGMPVLMPGPTTRISWSKARSTASMSVSFRLGTTDARMLARTLARGTSATCKRLSRRTWYSSIVRPLAVSMRKS
jgi:hypothetical protein